MQLHRERGRASILVISRDDLLMISFLCHPSDLPSQRLAQDGPEPVLGADPVEVARVALLHDAATEGVLGDVDAMAIAVLMPWLSFMVG